MVFYTFRAGSVHAVHVHKIMGWPISPRMCFAWTVSLLYIGVIQLRATPMSQTYVTIHNRALSLSWGGFLPIALTRFIFAILAIFDGASRNLFASAERVNEGFTKLAARDLVRYSAKIKICTACALRVRVSCVIGLRTEQLAYPPLFLGSSSVSLKKRVPKRFILFGLVMFFNVMNLDLNNGGRHFGSRFPSLFGVGDFNSFPPCYAAHPVVSGYSSMKCVATGSFTQIPPSQMEDIPDYLTVFVALSPSQFAQLCENTPLTPDPCSKRFGLHANQLTAAQKGPWLHELETRRTWTR